MRNKSIAALAALAAFGMGALSPVTNATGTSRTEVSGDRYARASAADNLQRGPGSPVFDRAMLRHLRGGGSHSGVGGYSNRAGWSNARYQRHARKLRNRAKHRAACKGGRA